MLRGVSGVIEQLKANTRINVRPLYGCIVVRRIEEQKTIQNGIVIPDSPKENHKKVRSWL